MSEPAARLGGGYAESKPDAGPTAAAVLAAASAGGPAARLVVLAGPPGVGKTTLAARLLGLVPGSLCLDKDAVAGGFVLEAARQEGCAVEQAYGTQRYWQRLRPLEYGGAMAAACANLIDRRTVFLVGGWGPELAAVDLWPSLAAALAPARLDVLHLDAPEWETWRRRLAARGSRSESPWFEAFAGSVTALPVWDGAVRLSTALPPHALAAAALGALGPGATQEPNP